jgi:hypothetical protein
MIMLNPRPIVWTLLICLGVLPGAAAERKLFTSELYPVSEGKRVVVDAGDHNVSVRGAGVKDVGVRTELRISGVGEKKAEAWIADRTPAVSNNDVELRVAAPSAASAFMGIGHLTSRARLGVVLPTTVVPDITTTTGWIRVRGDYPLAAPLRLRTSEGSMYFIGATRSLEIRTASGNAEVEVFRTLDSLSARSSSGNIALKGGAQHVEVDTASGQVVLSNLVGSAQVETSKGKVQLRWDRLDPQHHVKVSSTSGRVQLTVPEGVIPRGTLITTTGKIQCDLPGAFNDSGDTFSLSGDGPLIEVETASAEIVLSSGSLWDE